MSQYDTVQINNKARAGVLGYFSGALLLYSLILFSSGDSSDLGTDEAH